MNTIYGSAAVGILTNGVVGRAVRAASAFLRPPAWYAGLQRASFRGVPFAVRNSDSQWGRRNAVHEYPFRDDPWVEDLGRSARRISVTGFLISDSLIYGGGDVIAQRARLVSACEAPGSGVFVHPTLGQMSVTLGDPGLGVSERWDAGRYFEISFHFIEAGKLLFPGVGTDTPRYVEMSADALDSSAAADFSATVDPALALGASVIGQVQTTASSFGDAIMSASQDATSAFGALGELPGNNGLFAGGAAQNILSNLARAVPPIPPTVSSLMCAASAARANIGTAVSTMNSAAVSI